MAFRAFVAVPVPAAPPLTRLVDGLAALAADLKVVDPRALHLTLSFLGAVPDEAAARIGQAVERATRRHARLHVPLRSVGAFPHLRRPRVIWVGAAEAERLAALALDVREELQAAGFPGEDKEFKAHVTLARVRSERGLTEVVRFLRDHESDELPDLDVDEARLYASTLGPQGPAYETLATARLEA